MMTDISVYCLYKGKAHLSGLIISIKATVVSIQSVLGPQNTNIYHIRDWWLRPRVKGHINSFNMLFILNPQEDDPSMLISNSFFCTKCYKSCKSNFLEENCSHWNNLI